MNTTNAAKTLVPTTDLARRVAAIVHRKSSTPWSEKEIRTYKKLLKAGAFNEPDLSSVERFQEHNRKEKKRGRNGYHRRGLYTLLINWGEEVDHGTEHDELHPVKPPVRKVIPMPPTPSEPFIQTPEAKERTDRFMEEYRARKKREAI